MSENYLGADRDQEISTASLEGTYLFGTPSRGVTAFGGVGWGDISLSGSDFGEQNLLDFSGMGQTVGADARLNVSGPFSVKGGARYTVLYGDDTENDLENILVDVVEISLGGEYALQFAGESSLVIGLGYEHQIYNTDTYFPGAIDLETNGRVSLGGPSLSVSYNF